MNVFKQIKKLLDKREIIKLYFLVLFTIIVSLSEIIGLAMIVPFIAIVTDKSKIIENKILTFVYNFFLFKSYSSFIIFVGLAIIVIFGIKNILTIIYTTVVVNFVKKNYYLVTTKLMKKYITFPYQNYVKENTNTLQKNISTECNLFVLVFQNCFLLFAELVVILGIYLIMCVVNYKVTIVMSVLFLITVYFVKKLIVNKIKQWGISRAEGVDNYYKFIGAIFGNYKILKFIDNRIIEDRFKALCKEYVDGDKKFQIYQPIPKIILEFIGFSSIVLVIIWAMIRYGENGIVEIVPLLSLFFIGLYRILPSLNRIVNYYQNIVFYKESVNIIVRDLKKVSEELSDKCEMNFQQEIRLEKISFEYDENKTILQNISIQIKKGEKIAFVGESGSGKTTLVDIIIGLYIPKNGHVYVDDNILEKKKLKNWRNKIGYIPQEVYLFDGTVRENIIFGRKYDKEKFELVLKQAKLKDFLKDKNGENTIVGDKGIMLSGGQKQRVAIARALYGSPDILILDEATSALDSNTEEEIMNEIYEVSQDKTLIIIAHRLTTLRNCDRIVVLKNGKIDKIVKNICEIGGVRSEK